MSHFLYSVAKTTDEPNIVTFQSLCEEDFGHYQCEVKEAEKVVLTVHIALYREETSTFTNNQPISTSRDPL